jgi:hypothetical protein
VPVPVRMASAKNLFVIYIYYSLSRTRASKSAFRPVPHIVNNLNIITPSFVVQQTLSRLPVHVEYASLSHSFHFYFCLSYRLHTYIITLFLEWQTSRYTSQLIIQVETWVQYSFVHTFTSTDSFVVTLNLLGIHIKYTNLLSKLRLTLNLLAAKFQQVIWPRRQLCLPSH